MICLYGLSLAQDQEQLETVLREALCRQFDAEAATLKLFPLESNTTTDADPKVTGFIQSLDRERSLCGPLDPDYNGILFGEQSEIIGSVALIPIRTDLLDRLGEIVGQKSRTLH